MRRFHLQRGGWLGWLLLTCLSCSAPAPSQVPPAAPLWRLVGRFWTAPPSTAAPQRHYCAWTGCSMEAHFSGRQIAVTLYDLATAYDADAAAIVPRYNLFDVSIDAQPVQVLKLGHTPLQYVFQTTESPAVHHIRLRKRSEALLGTSVFEGFHIPAPELPTAMLPPGALLPAPAAAARRLEIIGDSISAGYGNLGLNANCSFSPDSEDGSRSYGSLAAEALHAEAVIIAWSGRGVWRNNDWRQAARAGRETLPQLYQRTLPAAAAEQLGAPAAARWSFTTPPPQAVVLNVGTNDFAGGVPDAAAFEAAYTQFVQSLRAHYPTAWLVCCLGPMLSDLTPSGQLALSTARLLIQRVVFKAQQAGDTRLGFLEFAPQDGSLGYGCDWHPNAATHAAMAAQLTQYLQQVLNWY